jgi:hypothetical protein
MMRCRSTPEEVWKTILSAEEVSMLGQNHCSAKGRLFAGQGLQGRDIVIIITTSALKVVAARIGRGLAGSSV